MSFLESLSAEAIGGISSTLILMSIQQLIIKSKNNTIKKETIMINALKSENESLKDQIAKLSEENEHLRAALNVMTQNQLSPTQVSPFKSSSQKRVYDYVTAVFGNPSNNSDSWWSWPDSSSTPAGIRERNAVMLDKDIKKNIVLRLNFPRSSETYSKSLTSSMAMTLIASMGLDYIVDSSGSSESIVRIKIKLPTEIDDMMMHNIKMLTNYSYNIE